MALGPVSRLSPDVSLRHGRRALEATIQGRTGYRFVASRLLFVPTMIRHYRCVGPNHLTGTSRRAPVAVILAAGRGSRLGDLTDDRPKCLATVGGRSLLEHQLEAIEQAGIKKVVIVTGYRARDVRRVAGGRARYVHNPVWGDTNSMYSLWCARYELGDDALIFNCDVLFHPEVIDRILAAGRNHFAIDRYGGLGEEEMHVALDGTRLTAMSKELPTAEVAGENVGIVRLSGRALTAVLETAGELISAGDLKVWMASAIDRVAADYDVHAVDISDLPWVEIDFRRDLEFAHGWVWPSIRALTQPIDIQFLEPAANGLALVEATA